MSRDIDQLIATLRRAHPELVVEQRRAALPGADDEDGLWAFRHPRALTDVHLESRRGELPFLIESELAPPTRAGTLADSARLVVARLGLAASTG